MLGVASPQGVVSRRVIQGIKRYAFRFEASGDLSGDASP